MSEHAPLIAIELILVFGGTLAFAWWQLRELKKLRKEREAKQAQTSQASDAPPQPAAGPHAPAIPPRQTSDLDKTQTSD